jgi:hypothetical protein
VHSLECSKIAYFTPHSTQEEAQKGEHHPGTALLYDHHPEQMKEKDNISYSNTATHNLQVIVFKESLGRTGTTTSLV